MLNVVIKLCCASSCSLLLDMNAPLVFDASVDGATVARLTRLANMFHTLRFRTRSGELTLLKVDAAVISPDNVRVGLPTAGRMHVHGTEFMFVVQQLLKLIEGSFHDESLVGITSTIM